LFRNWADVGRAGANVYLRPISKGLKAVDAIQKPNSLFQITVDSKHPIHASGLFEAVTALGFDGQVNLFFALPSDRYQDVEKQSYFRPKPRTDETQAQKAARVAKEAMEDKVLSTKVQQFALLVDCSVLSERCPNQNQEEM
jgi:hypothetical protein